MASLRTLSRHSLQQPAPRIFPFERALGVSLGALSRCFAALSGQSTPSSRFPPPHTRRRLCEELEATPLL